MRNCSQKPKSLNASILKAKEPVNYNLCFTDLFRVSLNGQNLYNCDFSGQTEYLET